MNKKIIVYSSESCAPCKMVKKLLNSKNIKFETRDIDNSSWQDEVFSLTKQVSVPVVLVEDEVVVGYNPSRLLQLVTA